MNHDLTTEDGRIAAAQEAGYNVARHEALAGHTEPRNWDKDDVHNAGSFSHLAAAGFTRLGARMFSQVFVDAYRQGFIETRLEYLRSQIEAEKISTAEIIELQGLADHIDRGDVLLLEWAGVPEFPNDDENDPQIYWEVGHADDTERVFGVDTAAIVDLQQGGVIAYCHKDNAVRIVEALRAASK